MKPIQNIIMNRWLLLSCAVIVSVVCAMRIYDGELTSGGRTTELLAITLPMIPFTWWLAYQAWIAPINQKPRNEK